MTFLAAVLLLGGTLAVSILDDVVHLGSKGAKVVSAAVNVENAAKDHAAAMKHEEVIHEHLLAQKTKSLKKAEKVQAATLKKISELKTKLQFMDHIVGQQSHSVTKELHKVTAAKVAHQAAKSHVKEIQHLIKHEVTSVKTTHNAAPALHKLNAIKHQEAVSAVHAMHHVKKLIKHEATKKKIHTKQKNLEKKLLKVATKAAGVAAKRLSAQKIAQPHTAKEQELKELEPHRSSAIHTFKGLATVGALATTLLIVF